MANLDIAAKVLLQEVPGAFVRMALGEVLVRSARSEDRRAACAIEANGSIDPARAFAYWSLAFQRFKRLETLVICLLRGDKQRSRCSRRQERNRPHRNTGEPGQVVSTR